MISVIIPLYNKENLIRNTLESVLSQTYQDFEIVIVNDGSTDGSADVVTDISDPRIRMINQSNTGVSAARNRGIKEAQGEYIAFLDADDEWKPEFLETMIYLKNKYPNCSFFSCNYIFRYKSDKYLETVLKRLPFDGDDGILNNYFEVAAYSNAPVCSITLMVKTNLIRSIGGFPIGIKSGEDLLTWARLIIKSKLAYSTKVLSIYNLGDGYDFSNLPPRRQDAGDPVGIGLKKILIDNPDTFGLKKYISHWHKMRASVAIRYGERIETIREVFESLRYYPLNFKVLPFFVLALLPGKLRIFIIRNHK